MPYRISASLGPTFRYMRAITIMIIKRTRTSSPAPTRTSIGSPNIRTSLFHSRLLSSCRSLDKSLLRELLPPLHVGNPAVIARNHHFGALLNGCAVIASRARATPRASKREDDFSGAVLANWHAQRSERPFDAAVFAAHRSVGCMHQLHHEFENHPAGEYSRQGRDGQRSQGQEMGVTRQQIASSTKPGEKRHDRGGVEPRDLRTGNAAFMEAAFGETAVVPAMKMKGQMPFDGEMDMDCAGEERKHAQREAHEKTEEIEI